MNNNMYSLHPVIVQGSYSQQQQPSGNQPHDAPHAHQHQPAATQESSGAMVTAQPMSMQAPGGAAGASQYVQIQQVGQRPMQYLQPSVIYPQQVQYTPQGADSSQQMGAQMTYQPSFAPAQNVQFVQIMPGSNGARLLMPIQAYGAPGQGMHRLTYVHPGHVVPQQMVQIQPQAPAAAHVQMHPPHSPISSSEVTIQEVRTQETPPPREKKRSPERKAAVSVSASASSSAKKAGGSVKFDKDIYEVAGKDPDTTGDLRVVFKMFRLLRRRKQEANHAEAFYIIELHGQPGDSVRESDIQALKEPHRVLFQFSVGHARTGKRRLIPSEVEKDVVYYPKLRDTYSDHQLSLNLRRISGIVAFKKLNIFDPMETSFFIHVRMLSKVKCAPAVSPEIHLARGSSYPTLLQPPDVSRPLPSTMWKPSKARSPSTAMKPAVVKVQAPTRPTQVKKHQSKLAGLKRVRKEADVIDLTSSPKRPKTLSRPKPKLIPTLRPVPGSDIRLKLIKEAETMVWIDGDNCWCAKISISGDLGKLSTKKLPVRVNVVGTDAILLALPTQEPCTIDVGRCTAFVLFRLFRRSSRSANDARKFRVYFDLGKLEGGVMSREMNVNDARIKTLKTPDLSVEFVRALLQRLGQTTSQLAKELSLNPKHVEAWFSDKAREGHRFSEVNKALMSWVHMYPKISESIQAKLYSSEKNGNDADLDGRKVGKHSQATSLVQDQGDTYLRNTTLGSMPFSELEVRVKVLYAKNALGYTFEQIVDSLNFDIEETTDPRKLMETWVIYDGEKSGPAGLTDVLNTWYDEQLALGKLLPFETRPEGLEDLFSTTIYKARSSNASGHFHLQENSFTEEERKKLRGSVDTGAKQRRAASTGPLSSKPPRNDSIFPHVDVLQRSDKSAVRLHSLFSKSSFDNSKNDMEPTVQASLVLLQWMKPLHAKRPPGRPKSHAVVYAWEGKGKTRRTTSLKPGTEAQVISAESLDKVSDNQIRKQIFPLLKLKGLTYRLVANEVGLSNVVNLRKWVQGECLEDSKVLASGKKLKKWFWKERYAIASSLAAAEREFIERPPDEEVLFEKRATRKVSKQQGIGAVGSGLNDDALTLERKKGIKRSMPIPLPSDVTKALLTINNVNKTSITLVGRNE